jgi:hypothetical protein
MKARAGFVSNSSSSSFIITTAKPMTQNELHETILKFFKVEEDSPLFGMAQDMAHFMTCAAERFETAHEWGKAKGYGDDEIPDYITKAFATGRTVFVGRVHTDGEWPEQALVTMEIDYQSDEISINKEANF